MTNAQREACKRNGRLGGRPRKTVIECTCGRSDGTHSYRCRINETTRKRLQRDKRADALEALAQGEREQ